MYSGILQKPFDRFHHGAYNKGISHGRAFLPPTKEGIIMKYVCDVCGWVYDEEAGYPEGGIAPGTKFEDLPEDFECPLCGVGKDMFSEA